MATNNAINLTDAGIVTFDGTNSFSGSTVTDWAVVCGDASNALQSVASVGAANTVLTSNGAGALPSFQANSGLNFIFSEAEAYDDFVGSDLASSGVFHWNESGAGNGMVDGISGHPGVISVGVSGGQNVAGYVANYTTSIAPYILGTGEFTLEFVIKLNITTGDYDARFGLGDVISTVYGTGQVNGVYFQFNPTVNSGNWTIHTVAASSGTTANTSTAGDTDWHRFKIVVNSDATSVAYFIDGSEVGNSPITATIPSAAVGIFMRERQAGGNTTDNDFYVDLVYYKYELTTTR